MSDSEGQTARPRFLVRGRRVRVRDLVDAQLLHSGDQLAFSRKRIGVSHTCVVQPDGTLLLEDGTHERTPSGAAMAASGMSAVDGWYAWRLVRTGQLLDDVRQAFLDSVYEDQGEGRPGADAHTRLAQARERAQAGQPWVLTVRELLSWWGLSTRDSDALARITTDLDNHGLVTAPEMASVGLDVQVSLTTPRTAESEGAVDPPDVGDSSEDTPSAQDVGIRVGNLPSALGGVEAVARTDSIRAAVTRMVLNDYSQLAVLSGARTLRGVVTWRSIAEAQARGSAETVSDAMVEAEVVPYDRDLIRILATIEEDDFVFVRDDQARIAGIVTAADVVRAYRDLVLPFFRIGEMDQLLRFLLRSHVSIDDIRAICDPDGERIEDFDDLSVGDYKRTLENQALWDQLDLPWDRKLFITRLDELRKFRNDVLHFNPDPVTEEQLHRLAEFVKALRSLETLK